MYNDRAYPSNSRFNVCSNGREYMVEDTLSGKTVSWHSTYNEALKSRNLVSKEYTMSDQKREYPKVDPRNVMRHQYRELTPQEEHNMKAVKDLGLAFYNLCNSLGESRELSMAKTNIEVAVIWAVKHITA